MDHMEKQLSSLSQLVHTALVSQGGMSKRALTESVYRDIQALRREILGPTEFDAGSDSGSISRYSDLSTGSLPHSDRGMNRKIDQKNRKNRKIDQEFFRIENDYD